MSLSLSTDYLQALEAISSLQMSNLQQNQSAASILAADTTSQPQKDTYVSGVDSTDTALPSDNYGYIMDLIKANRQAAGESASAPTDTDFETVLESLQNALNNLSENAASDGTTDSVSETTAADSTANTAAAADTSSASGTSGTGSSSDSDQTTVELVIGQDGSIYEKTTTTAADGTETVSVEKVAEAPKREPMMPDQNQMKPMPPQDQMSGEQTSGEQASGEQISL